MTSEVERFRALAHFWLSDIRHHLESALEGLKEELDSDDPVVSKRAEDDVAEILDWLNPALPPVSFEERAKRAEEAFKVGGREAAEKALRSTGRPKKRPRTETPQLAIRALSLRRADENMSWRKVALEVAGCVHKRPDPAIACDHCGEKIRNAVGRLETFLRDHGYHPDVPTVNGLPAKSDG